MFDLDELQIIETQLAFRERAIEATKRCTNETFKAHERSQAQLEASREILLSMALN